MTKDQACIEFLQWALPRLQMRWAGFRKVRRQVCRRVWKRIEELNVAGLEAYRQFLGENPGEWKILDTFCRIPISRFYRDRGVFDHLQREILPELAGRVVAENRSLSCWSVAGAAGEEPYTLALIVALEIQPVLLELELEILSTDIDEYTLERARRGCYSRGSLKEVPEEWVRKAFTKRKDGFFLRPAFRRLVSFRQLDVRRELPSGPFDLVLCRNLVATYFDDELQRKVFAGISQKMLTGGYLVLGSHEHLPDGVEHFLCVDEHLRVWRRT